MKCELCESEVDYCEGCDTCHACWEQGQQEVVDKLEAENKAQQTVIDAAKKAVSQHGVCYPIPSSGEWAMTELKQALAALTEGETH